MKVWNGFDFYFYLDRINQSSLKLRPGTQDYQEFFACGEGLSAEGRIILTILLILSNYFLLKKNPFLFLKLIVSYLIRLDARGQRRRCLPCDALRRSGDT